LIGVATYEKTSNSVTSLEIVGGVAASGVFLLFVALAGLYGTIKDHQVFLPSSPITSLVLWCEESKRKPVVTFQIKKKSMLNCSLIKGPHFIHKKEPEKIRAKVKVAKCWRQEQIYGCK